MATRETLCPICRDVSENIADVLQSIDVETGISEYGDVLYVIPYTWTFDFQAFMQAIACGCEFCAFLDTMFMQDWYR
jgi:hypothetical protein